MSNALLAARPHPIPPVRYEHLQHMSDWLGLFEHARGTEPRREEGYCVDDVSRGVVVLMREESLTDELVELARTYLDFLAGAQSPEGLVINRRSVDGRWTERPSLGDWWGRALWGFGAAAARSPEPAMRELAQARLERGLRLRAPWSRSMAFAALGAAELLAVQPHHVASRLLLEDAAALMGRPRDGEWAWPETRLTYANAAVAETLIAAGQLLGDDTALHDGLALLAWLLALETRDGHLSVTPAGGAGPSTARPGFDQQAIEVAAMADACARAYDATGDSRWLDGVALSVGWFLGDNDTGLPMYEAATGGGFDGLRAGGRNLNQGAESTLAALSTLQHGHRLLSAEHSG